MKILYIPLDTSIKKEDDFYIALKKAGHEVVWYWDHTWLDEKIDVAHFQSGAIERRLIASIKRMCQVVTQWTGDYRPEPMEMVTQYQGLVDITFMAAEVPELYPNENIVWLPHWVGDWQFRDINPNAKGIVMFANNYPQFPGGRERAEMHELLSERDDYTCYGSGWGNALPPVPYRETTEIYNNARFAVGCNIYNDVNKWFSNRPIIAMAAGCCFMWRKVPEMSYMDFTYNDNYALYDFLNVSWPNLLDRAKAMQNFVKEKFHADNIIKMWENEIKSF